MRERSRRENSRLHSGHPRSVHVSREAVRPEPRHDRVDWRAAQEVGAAVARRRYQRHGRLMQGLQDRANVLRLNPRDVARHDDHRPMLPQLRKTGTVSRMAALGPSSNGSSMVRAPYAPAMSFARPSRVTTRMPSVIQLLQRREHVCQHQARQLGPLRRVKQRRKPRLGFRKLLAGTTAQRRFRRSSHPRSAPPLLLPMKRAVGRSQAHRAPEPHGPRAYSSGSPWSEQASGNDAASASSRRSMIRPSIRPA